MGKISFDLIGGTWWYLVVHGDSRPARISFHLFIGLLETGMTSVQWTLDISLKIFLSYLLQYMACEKGLFTFMIYVFHVLHTTNWIYIHIKNMYFSFFSLAEIQVFSQKNQYGSALITILVNTSVSAANNGLSSITFVSKIVLLNGHNLGLLDQISTYDTF